MAVDRAVASLSHIINLQNRRKHSTRVGLLGDGLLLPLCAQLCRNTGVPSKLAMVGHVTCMHTRRECRV